MPDPDDAPKLYRAMTPADDNLPECGPTARKLGVRPPGNAKPDIDAPEGRVLLNRRGMSVARSWRELPPQRIPPRLDPDGSLGASGSNRDKCFVMGSGAFLEGASVTPQLSLALKPGAGHRGNVVPLTEMTVGDYQGALASTRADWVVDES